MVGKIQNHHAIKNAIIHSEIEFGVQKYFEWFTLTIDHLTDKIFAPAGFWPRRPKSKEVPRIPAYIGKKISPQQEKSCEIFENTARKGLPKSTQRIAERINTRRILEAESLSRHEVLKSKGKCGRLVTRILCGGLGGGVLTRPNWTNYRNVFFIV